MDGLEITRQERIEANQDYAAILESYKKSSLESSQITSADDSVIEKIEDEENTDFEKLLEQKRNDFQNKMVPHTPESRLQVKRI